MAKKKDHYQVLGITRSSTQKNIRKAFRQRAKECHPDHCGPEGEERFRELNAAHEVLSDPESRRSYDQQLDRCSRPHGEEASSRASAGPFSGWSRRTTSSRPWQPGELIRDVFDSVEPPSSSRWTSPPQVIDLELELSEREQQSGVHLPLDLTLARRCPRCAGRRRLGPFICVACGGLGHALVTTRIDVDLPPGLESGRVIHAPVNSSLVGKELILRLRIA